MHAEAHKPPNTEAYLVLQVCTSAKHQTPVPDAAVELCMAVYVSISLGKDG